MLTFPQEMLVWVMRRMAQGMLGFSVCDAARFEKGFTGRLTVVL